jgi:hypothetical protein
MRFLFGFLFVILFGCNDNVFYKVIDAKPEILVHPTEINFGHIKSGYESGSEMFSIVNVGNAALSVDPTLMDGSTRYNIQEYELDELILEPGEILDVPIDYTPITYEHNGAVVKVLSSDAENPEIFVTIEGYGDAPKIDANPEIVDYGNISIGCDNEYRITIENIGNLDLTLSSVIQMTTLPNDIVIDYGSLPEPPWVLIPGEQIDLLIKYTPTDVGNDESIVNINSNDPLREAVEIIQAGKGDVEHWIIEEWVQEEERIYDLLWVIDNSGSMRPFQTMLSQNMQNFVNQFLSPGDVDFRMGFITTDWYLLQGNTYIDDTTVNPAGVAASLVDGIGTHGSGIERGLLQVASALQQFDATGEFLRHDSNLIIIYVSDEQDGSPLNYNAYLNMYLNYKTQDKIRAYSVIGDYPSGCNSTTNNGFPMNADFGAGYYDITNHLGGSWFSICSHDWSHSMSNLAADITMRANFFLEKPDPVISTIEVYVNGQITTQGWSYESIDNKVVFDSDHIPGAGQTIRIEYATYGCGQQ